ncbi:hypothetical protein [Streptomyces koyangensis]
MGKMISGERVEVRLAGGGDVLTWSTVRVGAADRDLVAGGRGAEGFVGLLALGGVGFLDVVELDAADDLLLGAGGLARQAGRSCGYFWTTT